MHIRWSHHLARLPPTRRRAQNLSERYRKLENSARTQSESLASDDPKLSSRTIPPDTIAGFVIPTAPRAPADDECCMSGCAVCVYDVYEEALAAYKEDVATLRAELAARDIPETEWPVHIRTGGNASMTTRSVVLDAFEEMERALKEKQSRVEAEKQRLSLREVYEGIKWVIFPSH